MGGTTGSAFCSQFLNLSQYKFHATAVTTNSITIPGDDITQFRPILANLQHDDSGDAVPKSRGDLQEGQQQSSVGESPGSDLDERSEPPSKHAKHYIVGSASQTVFACKNTGLVPMQAVSSNLAGLTDITWDWTGFVPLVKIKVKAKFKQATLLDAADFTSIGSNWIRIMLGTNSDNYWYSGFQNTSYQARTHQMLLSEPCHSLRLMELSHLAGLISHR